MSNARDLISADMALTCNNLPNAPTAHGPLGMAKRRKRDTPGVGCPHLLTSTTTWPLSVELTPWRASPRVLTLRCSVMAEGRFTTVGRRHAVTLVTLRVPQVKRARAHTYTHARARTHTHTRALSHTHTHTRTHTHAHTHTHTRHHHYHYHQHHHLADLHPLLGGSGAGDSGQPRVQDRATMLDVSAGSRHSVGGNVIRVR
jgi:hypothetical protein